MGMSTTKSYFIQNSKRMMSRDRNRFISIIFATNLRVERESLKAGLARISIGHRLPPVLSGHLFFNIYRESLEIS